VSDILIFRIITERKMQMAERVQVMDDAGAQQASEDSRCRNFQLTEHVPFISTQSSCGGWVCL
jgi:hypothetical protein